MEMGIVSSYEVRTIDRVWFLPRGDYCLISYRGGLGTSLCIMGDGTQHPHSRKEHTALYNISKFGVNQANIRKDTAIQKLQILLRNVWNAGRVSGVPIHFLVNF